MQISLAFSANLLSETPSISPLKGEERPSKSPKTHPKNQRFFGDPEKTLYYTAYILQKQKTETQASIHI